MKRQIRYRLMHLLNVPCGAFGGEVYNRDEMMRRQNAGEPTERWCWKRFGHSDSCRYLWSTPDEDFRKSVYVGSYPPGKVRISLAQGCRPQEAHMVPADHLFGASAILELSNEHAWSLLTQLADTFGAKLEVKP